MGRFEQKYEEWINIQLGQDTNPRRRERLESGLGHGTVQFLRHVWFPAVGNFDHLYAEWEVQDFHSGYRYLDLAYMPGGVKGGIEIQGYGPHARDLDVRRFKDLCWRHCLLALDDWLFLPIAYLSITEETKRCQQLVLSFIGKFISIDVREGLGALEMETVRFARRLMRPFTPEEVMKHLSVSNRHARRILKKLTEQQLLIVAHGNERYRKYLIRTE